MAFIDIYAAKQPIIDLWGATAGYEFLYRASAKNCYSPEVDGSLATKSLISMLLTEFKLKDLTCGAPAYINCTRELLMSDYILLLGNQEFILEILEDVVFDPELIERLKILKGRGYKLALDDYGGQDLPVEVIRLCDIMKVDFQLTDAAAQRRIANKYRKELILLAEKVETEEELERAKKNGYELFQGYFFSHPIMLQKSVAEMSSATCVQLWNEIRRPDCDFNCLADILQKDALLSYQFLKKSHALQYAHSHRITSIRHAIVHLGIDEFKDWLLLVLMKEISGKGNTQKLRLALNRAVFAKELAGECGYPQMEEEAYMTGMFSLLGLIYGEDIENLVQSLGISRKVEAALVNREGFLGEILQFIKCYERAEWDACDSFRETYGLPETIVSRLYFHAVEVSNEAFSG